ncbi:MAG: hypothetical protein JO054_03415 [Actinobacteria bacterium]|nr:hypothetical protein [Actinomycetota bacterium]MBV9253259.1 hypothetical protein [Actinomycetota bacterium]
MAVALCRAGKRVYTPLFEPHGRVDLLCEDATGYQRVQCKTARLVGDALFFHTCSNTGKQPRDYRGEVDVFGVYSPELDQVFIVPVDVAPVRGCTLRLGPARNGQAKGVHWAKDYLLS